MRLVAACLFSGAIFLSVTTAGAQEIDWQKVDNAFGRKAAVVSGDVHRYSFPRTDLNVALEGVTVKPALALGGWVAFKPMHAEGMARPIMAICPAGTSTRSSDWAPKLPIPSILLT